MTFGTLVAQTRKSMGLSQKQLASKSKKENGEPISPQYLNDIERVEAAELNAVLNGVAAALRTNRTDWAALEREATDVLTGRGWRPDYVAIRNQADLLAPTPGLAATNGNGLVVLGAARLAGTRLIDNVEVRATNVQ